MNASAFRPLLLAVACAAGLAHAQQVYRIVGPDGRVTFSDQPPAAAAVPAPARSGSSRSTDGGSALPFELRQATEKSPVVLYTSTRCDACATARSLLAQRGIPYSEKTVSTEEDANALQRMVGSAVVPSLSVGGQQLRGFNDQDWAATLDNAGYPRSSQLPPAFRNPSPSPLVAVQRPPEGAGAAAAPADAPAAPAAAPPSGTPTPSNPAGIRF